MCACASYNRPRAIMENNCHHRQSLSFPPFFLILSLSHCLFFVLFFSLSSFVFLEITFLLFIFHLLSPLARKKKEQSDENLPTAVLSLKYLFIISLLFLFFFPSLCSNFWKLTSSVPYPYKIFFFSISSISETKMVYLRMIKSLMNNERMRCVNETPATGDGTRLPGD